MRMRTALAKSKNMVSIRILQAIGVQFIQDYITRFGFDADKHPPYLTMALGAGSVTPWQMVDGLLGVRQRRLSRSSRIIVRDILDEKGKVLGEAQPVHAGDEQLRVIDPRNAYLMDSMLHDVTIYGTAARASATLKRHDLAGKTGTTNEQVDAWFCGYQPTVVGLFVDRIRPAEESGQPGNRQLGGAADVDQLHGESAQGRSGNVHAAARRPRRAGDGRRRQRTEPGIVLQGKRAACRRARTAAGSRFQADRLAGHQRDRLCRPGRQ